ncbi:EscU/YscU/HrcU family type III secretion system export apparatus switch protein [Acidiphilium sp.]|uniref:EscU/YscU/HrcU family type III secretion system export apparatus switch protein n=1 Tax=Acidiphilium sp. TaxID=527 RepID=UPI003CFEBCD1
MAEKESRTEAATPAKLTKAQSEGDSVVSREVTTFGSSAAAVLIFVALMPAMVTRLTIALAGLIAHAGQADQPSTVFRAISPVLVAAGDIVIPIGLLVSVAAIVLTLLQTGFQFKKKAIGLHFERLSPLGGISNLFSLRHTITSLQSILKIIFIGSAIYVIIDQHIHSLFQQIVRPVSLLPATIESSFVSVLIAGAATQAVIAAADFVWSRRQFATRNQMSHEEIKDEQKETDGNPIVKAKLKALRALQAKRNLRAAMARATVVVTNPTHYAVALEYHVGQTQAPRVVAKGADHLAAKIREMAFELRVPIVPNPPLARALFMIDEDAEITPEHYRAVAEVIAYIWKLAERRAVGNQS